MDISIHRKENTERWFINFTNVHLKLKYLNIVFIKLYMQERDSKEFYGSTTCLKTSMTTGLSMKVKYSSYEPGVS